jgi:hypothetical protein
MCPYSSKLECVDCHKKEHFGDRAKEWISLPNLIKNLLGRSIVTAAPAGRDNDDVSMIHPMDG